MEGADTPYAQLCLPGCRGMRAWQVFLRYTAHSAAYQRMTPLQLDGRTQGGTGGAHLADHAYMLVDSGLLPRLTCSVPH